MGRGGRCRRGDYDVQTPLGSYFLTAASSSLVGAGVSHTSGETFNGQPVSVLISSTETPGWFEVNIISRLFESKEKMPILVITRLGPPPGRPLFSRQLAPSP